MFNPESGQGRVTGKVGCAAEGEGQGGAGGWGREGKSRPP